MVNSQNIAILSEKVAALEAAIKNAGIELPEVDSSDNGKALQVVNGAWATGVKIPAIADDIGYGESNVGEALDTIMAYPVQVKNVTHSATVAANGTANWNPFEDDIALTGYTPIGVIGFQFNNVNLIWVNKRIEDSAYGMLIANTSAASITQSVSYTVLYIKDTLKVS